MEYEKKAINEMVNDIYEQCIIDYLYEIVKDSYEDYQAAYSLPENK